MKYVFLLVLLIIASAGALLGGAVAYRWVHNMTQTVRIVPGERILESEYGKRRALVRNEMAAESISADRATEEFLHQFARFSLSSLPGSSSAKVLQPHRIW